ncbi:chemotaxis protein CheW [Desulfonema magnum]|uniref:CheW-like domain-containing protein n=1 Tax=Desulfonema magnum TaxID=45655 RepID=A0A975BLB0_9BACT|nr:chemotaxis protein CheW [Desulfonema magnum]QTA87213.1 CheW-like domain-containing protein [Desulfonema magnum]
MLKALKKDIVLKTLWLLAIENERLRQENAAMNQEKADMEAMMEMANEHADGVGSELLERVDASIKEIEQQIRVISETIPVPVVIIRIRDGSFMYANEHLCRVFGISHATFSRYNISDLYENPADEQVFFNLLDENERLNNFEVRLKRTDGDYLWGALFTRAINFANENCVMTVIYDLTERKASEEKIRSLTEELEKAREKELKYLVFTLANEEYAILLTEVKEVVPVMALTPVPWFPDFIKGVINLRGRVIPVADLRRRLRVEAADFTDRTCIVIINVTGNQNETRVGMIVDSVVQVLGIRQKHILPTPTYFADDVRFISGIATIGDKAKILLDINHLWEERELRDVCSGTITNDTSTHLRKRELSGAT